MTTVFEIGGRLPDRIDRIDRKIIFELQRDATLSIAQIAARVGLSPTPCWKRIQKLEQTRVITGRVALVDPARVGFGLTVFVEIEAPDHSPAWREEFASAVAQMPEVLEVYRMAGQVDFLLKLAMPDMAAFDEFYKRLTASFDLKNVASQFAMERVKATTAYPVNTTDAEAAVVLRRPGAR